MQRLDHGYFTEVIWSGLQSLAVRTYHELGARSVQLIVSPRIQRKTSDILIASEIRIAVALAVIAALLTSF